MKSLSIQKLIDLHIEERAGVPSNRETSWEELGKWQLQTMINLGMNPESLILDIGCGPLRFGMYAIQYLNSSNYFGVEVWEPYLSLGAKILQELKIEDDYSVIIDESFNYASFGKRFDFAIAQSVVTHLSNAQFNNLLTGLKKVMLNGGKFLFTYNNNWYPYSVFYEMTKPMMTPSGLTDDYFKQLESEYEISFERLTLEHPTGQIVSVFKF